MVPYAITWDSFSPKSKVLTTMAWFLVLEDQSIVWLSICWRMFSNFLTSDWVPSSTRSSLSHSTFTVSSTATSPIYLTDLSRKTDLLGTPLFLFYFIFDFSYLLFLLYIYLLIYCSFWVLLFVCFDLVSLYLFISLFYFCFIMFLPSSASDLLHYPIVPFDSSFGILLLSCSSTFLSDPII